MIRLIPAGPTDFRALKAGTHPAGRLPEGGLEPDETLAMLEAWSARLLAAQGWGHWLALSGGEIVASLAVKDPARDGAVEIGYAVAPARRGRGFAREAVAALLPVLAAKGVLRVRAETATGNPASARVLQSCGFVVVGQRDDAEDGPLVLWERALTGA